MVMASAGGFFGSVRCHVVLWLVIYLALKTSPKVYENRERINVEMSVASRDSSLVNIIKLPSNTKVCYKKTMLIEFNKKVVKLLRLVNITLAVNILLSNDVSTNPGPQCNHTTAPKGLRIYHLNICRLHNKMDELCLFCNEHRLHVLALNETWLDASFDDKELSIPGYGVIRNDRNKFGGGKAIYLAENLAYEEVHINYSDFQSTSITSVEALWIKIKPNKSAHLLLGSLYRPPNSDGRSFISYLESALASVQHESLETMLLGDFNLDVKPHIKTAMTNEFLHTMQHYDLHHSFKNTN